MLSKSSSKVVVYTWIGGKKKKTDKYDYQNFSKGIAIFLN